MARLQPVFNFSGDHVNVDNLKNLAAQLNDWQGIDRVVDRLAAYVGISEVEFVRTAQLAGSAWETNAHSAYEPPAHCWAAISACWRQA